MRAHVFMLACLFCAVCGRRVQTISGEFRDDAQSSVESSHLQSAEKAGTPDKFRAFALLLLAFDPAVGFHVPGLGHTIATRSAPGVQHQAYATGAHRSSFVPAARRDVSMSATTDMAKDQAGTLRKRDRVRRWIPSARDRVRRWIALGTEQDFLEFEPYHDKATMPNNVFKPKDPFTGTIKSVKKITKPGATGETYDIVIDHGGEMPYVEGQSYGVIPAGTNPKTGKPNTVRLYSIASSRYGDDMTGTTTTLCVRRATYWCPELKAEDPAKKGVCSNYLCDAKAGDLVQLTGPTGKVMLLPEEKPETDIIMVATGTGIAPFRSFLRRIFVENTPYAKDFKGLAWLFLGVANSNGLLYDDEWKAIQKEHPDQFRYEVALSREQTNKDGDKMYIQDRVEEYADEIFERLDKGAHIYFCGLKGMMPGIQDMLEKVAKRKGLDYEEFIQKLKSNHQWHVEVY